MFIPDGKLYSSIGEIVSPILLPSDMNPSYLTFFIMVLSQGNPLLLDPVKVTLLGL
jgi:hypothetical protein